jgi:hypothetical protein
VDEGEMLELGSADGRDGDDRIAISEIKTTDLPFTNERLMNKEGWSRHRYLAALIGKSARAAQGAYEYTRDGATGGLGHRVEGLEPSE